MNQFCIIQDKIERRLVTLEDSVAAQATAVSEFVQTVDFNSTKIQAIEHSLESLRKAAINATRDLANAKTAIMKLGKTLEGVQHARARDATDGG